MSEANVEIARRAIEAWNRQDMGVWIGTWHPEAEWRPAFPKGTEGTGTVFRGHDGIEEAWRNVREAWDVYRVEAADARIVISDFRDGKIWRSRTYLDHGEALRAAGLSE